MKAELYSHKVQSLAGNTLILWLNTLLQFSKLAALF